MHELSALLSFSNKHHLSIVISMSSEGSSFKTGVTVRCSFISVYELRSLNVFSSTPPSVGAVSGHSLVQLPTGVGGCQDSL